MLVKENQPDLFQELQYWFDHAAIWRQLDRRTASTVNKGHGRLERRTVTVSEACRDLDWPDLAQVMCFEARLVNTKTGQVSHSRSFAVTSLPRPLAVAAQLLALRRQHWAIENRLHYPRDVRFQEDASRIRSGQAPTVLAAVRNAMLNLLRGFGYDSLKKVRERFAAQPIRALGLLELPVDFRLERISPVPGSDCRKTQLTSRSRSVILNRCCVPVQGRVFCALRPPRISVRMAC